MPALTGCCRAGHTFRRAWPTWTWTYRQRLAFGALPALVREEVDLVISSDPEDLAGVTFQPLFDYAPTLVVPAGHPLAAKGHADPPIWPPRR